MVVVITIQDHREQGQPVQKHSEQTCLQKPHVQLNEINQVIKHLERLLERVKIYQEKGNKYLLQDMFGMCARIPYIFVIQN